MVELQNDPNRLTQKTEREYVAVVAVWCISFTSPAILTHVDTLLVRNLNTLSSIQV